MTNLLKPSELLTAAIAGINDALSDPNFIFDMYTFGSVTRDGRCCGCVATATLQKLMGTKFSRDEISSAESRAKALQITQDRLEELEQILDDARCGSYCELLGLMNIPDDEITLEEKMDPLLIQARFVKLLKAVLKYS